MAQHVRLNLQGTVFVGLAVFFEQRWQMLRVAERLPDERRIWPIDRHVAHHITQAIVALFGERALRLEEQELPRLN